MAKPNTKCRVCGKEYYCCADHQKLGGWKTMACSEEHYKEYMKRIAESRKPMKIELDEVQEEIDFPKVKRTKMKATFYVENEVKNEDTEEIPSEE